MTGGPRTGKTYRAQRIAEASGVRRRSTDDLIGRLAWSESSAEVARWLDEPGPWVIEGVAVPRALRKWLAAHPVGLPADRVAWLTVPFADRTPGQVAMAKGVETVWREVLPELVRRGVLIEA